MSDNIVAVGGRTERDLGGLHACVLRWWQPIVVHDWCVCVCVHMLSQLWQPRWGATERRA